MPKTVDQGIRAAGLKNRPKLGPPRGKLAYGACKINVDDAPAFTRAAHQIIERYRLSGRREQLGVDDPPGIARFDGYSGERFEVDPNAETRNTGKIVHTKLIQSSGEPITLDYLVRGSGNDWKIVDVYLTGTISELATRRSEFSAILKSGGPNALVESLRQQAEKLMRAPA